jgi:hypothetical protein
MRSPQRNAPPPCFYFNLCGRAAEIDKCGRSVCRVCAAQRLRGREYTPRDPRQKPPYGFAQEAAEALDMSENSDTRSRGPYSNLFPRV